jgi:hypothetical protein
VRSAVHGRAVGPASLPPLLAVLAATFALLSCSSEERREIAGCTIEPKTSCPDTIFEANADFRDADLRRAKLQRAQFVGTDLRRGDFTGADLRGAMFAGSDLRDAIFVNADLSGAQFGRNEDLQGVDFTDADLTDANLGGVKLQGAAFVRTTLNGARLVVADLTGAELRDIEADTIDLQDASGLTPATLAAAFGVAENQVAALLVERGIMLLGPEAITKPFVPTVCMGAPVSEAAAPGAGATFHPIAASGYEARPEWLAPGPQFVEFVVCAEVVSETVVGQCGPYTSTGPGGGQFSIPVVETLSRVRVLEAKTAVVRADQTFVSPGPTDDCPSSVTSGRTGFPDAIRGGQPAGVEDLIASFVGEAPVAAGDVSEE